MSTEQIKLRIKELEDLEVSMAGIEKIKREQLAAAEECTQKLRKEINESLFINRDEYIELNELKITLKYIEAGGIQNG